ncbi:Bidirectional sugar transporter SWEET1 [Dendrobium catenatum]|uniref:Bidirectional sugar transporter SWEET1 n=1 Tax=Dendrobium catenatum TaxID=906689 RepID=A0A2I0W5H7_9ASPA|nr:Bidirectional sugar transporter SWEET1 [Dendrobium catenatum]
MLVWTINGTGAVIEAIYVLIFLIYAPKKVKARMFGLLALVSSLFAAVALISVLSLHGHTRKLFCGSAATIFSICMYASPLSIMIPNGCGSALGAVQLILYVIYRNNKGEISAATASKGEAIEMGDVKPSQENVYNNEKKKQNERSENEQV